MIKKQKCISIFSYTIINCGSIFLFILFLMFILTKPLFAYGEDVLQKDKEVTLTMERLKYFDPDYNYSYNINDFSYNDYVLAEKLYSKIMKSNKKLEKIKIDSEEDLIKAICIMNYKYFYYSPITEPVIEEGNKNIKAYLYIKDIKKEKEKSEKIEKRIKEIIKECNFSNEMTVYEALDILDDWFIKNVNYDYTYKALSIEDPLFNNKAICATYSEAFQEIANYIGIEAHLVVSLAMNHEWNLVKINDNEYMIDTCWNSCEKSKRYFMLTAKNMTYMSHPGLVNITNKDRKPLKNIIKLNYILKKGTTSNQNGFIIGKNFVFNKPTKLGFEFGGWYKDENYTIPIDNTFELIKDMNLEEIPEDTSFNIYAKWIPKEKETIYKINKTKIKVRLNNGNIKVESKKLKTKKLYIIYTNSKNKEIKKQIKNTYQLKNIYNKSNIKLKLYNKKTCIKTISLEKFL